MSWRINQINIKNFKFFHSDFVLNVNKKHLLIYGENGSGKSSIYWALYTLFQSRIKNNINSVKKYFDPTNDENLINKFSDGTEESKIEVVFEVKDGSLPNKNYYISYNNINTQDPADTFLAFTVSASDFINYKMISKLTDKENSVINDVTDLFIKEIYPYIEFRNPYIDINGNNTYNRNAIDWHQYILSSLQHLEHQKGSRHKQFDKNGLKYGNFVRLINSFRNELSLFLNDLTLRSNEKIKNEFGINDVEIIFETDPIYLFDLPNPTHPRSRDHMLHPLHIRLLAKFVNADLIGGNKKIIHLRTFFNEAKLTCIGLAIRLAIVDIKYISGSNLASVLCLDDMLVSLDMGYRVPVIKSILNYSKNYQLCIFTHDRSLYHMIQSSIKELGFDKNDWKYLEFYHPDPKAEGMIEPEVNYFEAKTYRDKILINLKKGDYPTAGNYLRKYAEELIKSILPFNLTFKFQKEDIKSLMLKNLFDKTKSNDFLLLYGISSTIMPDISQYIQRLMNPLSHDDKDVPIYRKELEDAYSEVIKYEPIAAAKKIIVRREEAGIKRFTLEMNNGSSSESIEFVTTEQWDYFNFPLPTGKKYKNCEIKILSSITPNYIVNSKIRIKQIYENMKNRVFHTLPAPDFDTVITEVSSGAKLNAL